MLSLTDDQIHEAVARMLPTDERLRAELLRQALSGDVSARFVIAAAYRRSGLGG
jgi:hypothetical protein